MPNMGVWGLSVAMELGRHHLVLGQLMSARRSAVDIIVVVVIVASIKI
jgi:hypothetical protein